MRVDEYERINALEETHWWYRSLRTLVMDLLRCFLKARGAAGARAAPAPPRVLDAGCGTGGMAVKLSEAGEVTGMDLHPEALEFCRQRGLPRLVQGTVERLPFAPASFEAVVSLDVLYHAAVADDEHAVREMARVLRPGGVMILNLPAYNWLRGSHDEVIHTARRYTRRQVQALVHAAGLTVVWSSHWNTLLLPIAVLVRMGPRFLSRRKKATSSLGPVPPILNEALVSLLDLERRLLKIGALPVGLSVLVVARRAEDGGSDATIGH